MPIKPILGVLVILTLGGSAPQACECGWFQNQDGQIVALSSPPPLDSSELQNYRAVFEGRVVTLDKRTVGSDQNIVATVEVVRRWKGKTGSPVTVGTPAFATACGYAFNTGETYLFFTGHDPARKLAQITSCSRTVPINQAQKELDQLNRLLGKPKQEAAP